MRHTRIPLLALAVASFAWSIGQADAAVSASTKSCNFPKEVEPGKEEVQLKIAAAGYETSDIADSSGFLQIYFVDPNGHDTYDIDFSNYRINYSNAVVEKDDPAWGKDCTFPDGSSSLPGVSFLIDIKGGADPGTYKILLGPDKLDTGSSITISGGDPTPPKPDPSDPDTPDGEDDPTDDSSTNPPTMGGTDPSTDTTTGTGNGAPTGNTGATGNNGNTTGTGGDPSSGLSQPTTPTPGATTAQNQTTTITNKNVEKCPNQQPPCLTVADEGCGLMVRTPQKTARPVALIFVLGACFAIVTRTVIQQRQGRREKQRKN